MTAQGSLQLVLYLALLVAAAKPLGMFMGAVYEGRRTWLTPVLGGLERAIYRLGSVDEHSESDWRRYAQAALLFLEDVEDRMTNLEQGGHAGQKCPGQLGEAGGGL